MKKTIYTDCHFFGVDPIENVTLEYTQDTIFMGDNFEFKNINSKILEHVSDVYDSHMRKVGLHGSIELVGNHEVNMTRGRLHYIEDGVLFIHIPDIDFLLRWGKKSPCRNVFKIMVSKLLAVARNIKPNKTVSKKNIERCIKLSKKFNCHTVVFTHTHIKEKYDKLHKGIRIINLPRGKTELIL